jgi:hypothetical protein
MFRHKLRGPALRGDKHVASKSPARVAAVAPIIWAFGLGGCVELGRLAAVSAEDTGRASVRGISDARFLASDTAALTALAGRPVRPRGQVLRFPWSPGPAGVHPGHFRRRRQRRVRRRSARRLVGNRNAPGL